MNQTPFTLNLTERPLSYSSLKAFQKSPQHFVMYREGKKEPTPAMEFGNIVDCLILTPELYEKKYAVMPSNLERPGANILKAKNPSPESIEKIKKWDEWTSANVNKTWISSEDAQKALFLKDKTYKNEKAVELIGRKVKTQVRMNWNEAESGLPFVGYIDLEGDSFILDLKTAATGDPEDFMKQAYNLGYHIQAAAYVDAYRKLGMFKDYWFLVVETSEPNNITVFKADKDFMELGHEEYKYLCKEFKMCMETDQFYKGYEFRSAMGYFHLDIPAWAKQRLKKFQ